VLTPLARPAFAVRPALVSLPPAKAAAATAARVISLKAHDGLLLALLALLAAALFVASALIGRVPFTVSAAVTDLWHGRASPAALILFDLRFPRALLGLLVGMTLGLSR
jgi:iron complex transport system permease protein